MVGDEEWIWSDLLLGLSIIRELITRSVSALLSLRENKQSSLTRSDPVKT